MLNSFLTTIAFSLESFQQVTGNLEYPLHLLLPDSISLLSDCLKKWNWVSGLSDACFKLGTVIKKNSYRYGLLQIDNHI